MAWLIDAAIVYVGILFGPSSVFVATTPESTFLEPSPSPPALAFVLMSAAFLAAAAYPVYFQGAQGGQTPGMRAVGVRVLREVDGRPLGFRLASGRLLAQLARLWGIGLLVALVDKKNQTLQDQISGTVMVRISDYPSGGWPGARSWTGAEFAPAAFVRHP